MATEDSLHATSPIRTRFPFAAAGVLLAVYAVMYLAIAGAVHVLTAPDAVAAIVAGSSTEQAAVGAPAISASPVTAIPAEPRDQPSTSTDAARECQPTEGVNTECLYN